MTAIKQGTTNQMNKERIFFSCPVTFTLERIGGRWKPLIIYNLLAGPLRYAALRRSLPGITEKMLIQQLKQLEQDGLIIRKVEPVVPPHVEYSLTEAGHEMKEVLLAMSGWAFRHGTHLVASEMKATSSVPA
jgi:DNA-binding HxlR family transcriptional regulator